MEFTPINSTDSLNSCRQEIPQTFQNMGNGIYNLNYQPLTLMSDFDPSLTHQQKFLMIDL
jgi:hypothetical protein